jgi:hypothetical protein
MRSINPARTLGLAAALLYLVLYTTLASAQLAVSDAPVEANTTAMVAQLTAANSQLVNILTQDAATATSVTAAGGAGRYQSQDAFLSRLMQTLAGGVADANTFATLFPGWMDFGPDAALMAAQITNSTLTTYADAITVAQSQAADFSAEDAQFAHLEACNAASIGVLQAIQCGNEIQLAAAQQTQLLRQLEITRLIVDAVHDGEELNEKSQFGANAEVSQLTAAQQQ